VTDALVKSPHLDLRAPKRLSIFSLNERSAALFGSIAQSAEALDLKLATVPAHFGNRGQPGPPTRMDGLLANVPVLFRSGLACKHTERLVATLDVE